MTEADIVTALQGLVGGRFYPDAAEYNTQLPYMLYQQVGGVAVNYLEGAASDKKNARLQITVWSKTRKEAKDIINAVENIMVQAPILAVVEGAHIARYDELSKLRGAHQDFSVWFSS